MFNKYNYVELVHYMHFSLTQVIRKFAKQLDDWLHIALDSLPENLQKIKYDRKYTYF